MTDMFEKLVHVVDGYIGDISTSQAIVMDTLNTMREPTEEMIDAVREIGGPQAAAYAIAAWPTMIDAALGDKK